MEAKWLSSVLLHEISVTGDGPVHRLIKVNCDGAWSATMSQGGYGWVARSSVGLFIAAGGVGGFPCISSPVTEAERQCKEQCFKLC